MGCLEVRVIDLEEKFYVKIGDFLSWLKFLKMHTVKTLNIGTPRPATVVVLYIKQFNFTMK